MSATVEQQSDNLLGVVLRLGGDVERRLRDGVAAVDVRPALEDELRDLEGGEEGRGRGRGVILGEGVCPQRRGGGHGQMEEGVPALSLGGPLEDGVHQLMMVRLFDWSLLPKFQPQ